MTLSEMFRGCLGPFLGSLGPFLAPEPWVNSTDTQSDVYELFRSVFRKFRSIFGSFRSFSLVNILQNTIFRRFRSVFSTYVQNGYTVLTVSQLCRECLGPFLGGLGPFLAPKQS